MNLRVFRLDQRMSISLTINKHRLQSLLFCFAHAEHHLIKLKLYNNRSAQAVNSLLCETRRNQANLLTFKNKLIKQP